MERKLATVLFVDPVGSTQLVTGTDPEAEGYAERLSELTPLRSTAEIS